MFAVWLQPDINILMNIDKLSSNTVQICTWICKQQTVNRLASISISKCQASLLLLCENINILSAKLHILVKTLITSII